MNWEEEFIKRFVPYMRLEDWKKLPVEKRRGKGFLVAKDYNEHDGDYEEYYPWEADDILDFIRGLLK